MGLLDNLMLSSNANYGGQNAGLLDMLRTFQMQQSQYQPSAGFAAEPNQPSPLDTAQYPAGPIGAPSNALAQTSQNPIAVGDYQMPRIGDPQQFTPDPAALPQNAQPTQGQLQPQPMQVPPLVAPSPGIGDRLMAGLQGFAHAGGLLPALADGITGLATGQRSDKLGMAQQSANLTARALLSKGIDPAAVQAAITNPELMKTLVTQAYGPQTVQSLGNGYVADKNGKVTRAYEPDDKIPVGFQKTDNGLQPIPGGPADPAYLRLAEAQKKDPNGNYVLGRGGEVIKNNPDGTVTVLHKNATDVGPGMSDDAVDFAAKRAIAGDTKALTGLGRGNQGRETLIKINERIAQILKDDPDGAKTILNNVAQQAGLVSASRALGTKETHFGVAEKAMEESIPIARAASAEVPRTQWKGLTQLIQMGQTQANDPKLKRLLIATDTAVKDYARTINPTGALRESDIEYARKVISPADSPEAYNAALDQLQVEAGVMHRAIQRQKTELRGGTSHQTDAQPATIGKTKKGVNWGFIQ